MSENDVNLAALWVPVLAETSQLKGQLVKAGTEAGVAGAVAMREAFAGAGIFSDLGKQVVPQVGVLTRAFDTLSSTAKKAKEATAGEWFNAAGIASVVGLGAAMVATTKKAGDFQASQERLVASAGETKAGMDQVSNGILQLAGQVGYSAGQLSDAMYTVEKAGYRGADGVNVLKAAAQGAKAENSDLKEVLSGVTTTLTDFHLGSDKAADVMSQMVAATGMAKTNFQEFSGALHSVEPIASGVGASLADVYGSLAQITQSGTGAAQAAQNMGRAYTTLANPTQKMRDELGQLGLNAEDISQHLGQRGLAGSLQLIANTVRGHMNPAQQVMIDTFYKSEQASGAAKKMFDNMAPAVKNVAEQVKNGTLSYKEFRKSRGGLDVEQANELQQWLGLNNKIAGYSSALKSGQGDIQTFMQAMSLATGNQETARIALQLTGDATDATNQKIQEISATTREHDGTVKGFNETQSTLNAKMADAKAAFGAAAIEIGTAFIPVMTDVANIAKDVGDAMAKHPAILHGAVTAVEALATAWLAVKAVNIVSSILTPATVGLEAVTVAETEATVAAGGLKTALLGLAGPIGIGLAVGPQVGKGIENLLNKSNWLNDHVRNPVRNFFGADSIPDQHAGGGGISGPGSKGKDSVLSWLAPGEHVLTSSDVDSLGGQSGVYNLRKALHRAGGGEIPHFDNGGASPSVPLIQKPDGTWTSPNPAWAHLIQRESSGNPTVQNNTDSNAAAGDPSQGLFQFTTGTWLRMGGGQFAPHPGQATPQQQAIMAAKLIQANPSGSDWGAGIPGRESASGLLGGLGTAGNPIYTAPTAERAARADAHVKEIQERLSELKPDAKQSTKDRLNDELGFAQQDQARAHAKESEGGGTGSGQGKTQSQAEQFGSGLLSGFMSDIGFGNVLGGKSPLEWPLVKMFTGLASAGLSAGNAWAESRMAGGPGGIPGLNSSGGGSGESSSGLGGVSSGLGEGTSSADAALAAGPGGGGGADLSAIATSPMLSIPKLSKGWFGQANSGAGPGGGPNSGGIHTQNDYRLFQAGVLDANGNPIPHGPVSGPIGDALTGGGRGKFPTGSAGPGDSFVPSLLMPGHDFGPGLLGGPSSSPGTPQRPYTAPSQPTKVGPPSGPPMTLVPHFSTGGSVGYYDGGGAVMDDQGHQISPGWHRWAVSHGPWEDSDTRAPMRPNDRGMFDNGPVSRTQDGMMRQEPGDQIMTPWAMQKSMQAGFKSGPRGTDTVPAWLSPGEFVVNSSATKKFGPQLKAMNAQHFASGGNVSLTPSSVSSVPTTASHGGGTSYSGGHHVVNDNRIIVQGNHLSDTDQLVGPMQERMNAQVYSRSQFGGLPMAVGPGGG